MDKIVNVRVNFIQLKKLPGLQNCKKSQSLNNLKPTIKFNELFFHLEKNVSFSMITYSLSLKENMTYWEGKKEKHYITKMLLL